MIIMLQLLNLKKIKEDKLKVIVINPPNEEVTSVNLEDDKIWGLTRFFKIKTFTTLKEYTKIENKIVKILVIDEVPKEEIENLMKNCNMVKINK